MQAAATAAHRAGDVVAVGRRQFIVVADRVGGGIAAVLVRRGQLDRLRSHVLPEPEDLRLAGLPMADLIVCCDRLRPAPPARSMRIGQASPKLLADIARTLRRCADAVAMESAPSIRSSIWRAPHGGRGRQVGAKSVS